jgi:hypothetical protein
MFPALRDGDRARTPCDPQKGFLCKIESTRVPSVFVEGKAVLLDKTPTIHLALIDLVLGICKEHGVPGVPVPPLLAATGTSVMAEGRIVAKQWDTYVDPICKFPPITGPDPTPMSSQTSVFIGP